jgi:hypothetical protein
MDVSLILFAAQSVRKMMFPALAKKCLHDSHGRRSLDMVPPLKRWWDGGGHGDCRVRIREKLVGS